MALRHAYESFACVRTFEFLNGQGLPPKCPFCLLLGAKFHAACRNN